MHKLLSLGRASAERRVYCCSEVPMADPDLCGRTVGEFVLRERIDEDSSGAMYRAEQPLLGRDVVVKVLHQRHDADALQRFKRSAQLASRLDHPYAAHIYAFGVECEDDLPWIAMELVHGISLQRWLQTHGPMTLARFVPFFECIAEVVQAAHDRGIEHLDLKPSNVMVIEGAGRLIPKLLNFGMGPPADIHALGVLAYEALTGHVPFTVETLDELGQLHGDAPVPPVGGNFSPDLDRIFQRALAKNPADRHGNVLELTSELRAALRTSEPEQLRSLAQQWEDRGRPPGLLLRGDALTELTHGAPARVLGEPACSFAAASQRRARRIRWGLRSLGALAMMIAVFAYQDHATRQTRLAQEQTRSAQRVAEATITQAELEQGLSALLHGEPEASLHLGRAYHRGDHTPSTKFVFARALQPKLAEQARFASSFGRMWSAAFSPDSRQVVTTDDRGAQVWDAQTSRLLFALPHGSEVYQAVYSTDGTRLVTVAQDAIRIWDAASGALVHKLTQQRNDGTSSNYFVVAISFDGRLVSAFDAAGSVAQVWDAITGALLAELRNDPMEFPGLAFSADGRWLAATGGNDVRVFDTQTWRPVLTIHGPRIHRLAFDPTSARLATGAATGDVAIWEIPSGVRVRHLRDVGEPIDAVAFSPDGQLVVAASRDGAERVWHAGSGELQSQFNPRHSRILAVEFDQASKLVLAAVVDGTVVVADAALGMPVTVLEGPQKAVRIAHFDPSSRRVVGASFDGTARVWDATSPYRRFSSPPVSDDCGIVTNAEPDRRFIAVGCRDHATRVWDTSRDHLLAELPSVSHVGGGFTSAFPAVSGAGDRAAVARGNTVEVYELPGGHLLCTIAHGAPVNAVAFATAGRDIISGAIDGSLRVTRDDGARLALPISAGGIDAVALLPDGRVVAADAERRLRVYDRSGAVLADLEIPMRVMSLRIDGPGLVAVPIAPVTANVAPPLLLDLERYRIIAQLEGHVGRVASARWVAGHQILTAGRDGTARLWDGSTGLLRQIYGEASRPLADATLSPDGVVMAGGGDGMLWFWDVTSGRLLWALQAHTSQLIGVHVEGRDIVTRGFAGEVSRWTLPGSEQVIEACDAQERCAIMHQ
jgi:WD40 repeat protein